MTDACIPFCFERGQWADYLALARYHYRAKRPATVHSVWRMVVDLGFRISDFGFRNCRERTGRNLGSRFWVRGSGLWALPSTQPPAPSPSSSLRPLRPWRLDNPQSEIRNPQSLLWRLGGYPTLAAVLVVSLPVLQSAARNIVTGGRYAGRPPAPRAGRKRATGCEKSLYENPSSFPPSLLGRGQGEGRTREERTGAIAWPKDPPSPRPSPLEGEGERSFRTCSKPTAGGGSAGRAASSRAKRRAARRLNRELLTISRVIVHPLYRGLGLATRLAAGVLDELDVPMIEAFARMGEYVPLFERAGMRALRLPGKPVYYWKRKDDGHGQERPFLRQAALAPATDL